MSAALRAPFPWFGGKSRAAHLVWEALGDVPNYVEPFFGSGAVLLARPHAPRIETVNDLDGMVSNFWRAVRSAPAEVAHHADWPVIEQDLHARHQWLVDRRESLTERLSADPEFFDAKAAGWWCWGRCCWIGTGWCSKPVRQLPDLGSAGKGIHTIELRESVEQVIADLSARLRRVRVACGDWKRVLGRSVTTACHGCAMRTGVFLDPPYKDGDADYAETADSSEVCAWAVAHGDDPLFRIVLCGHEGEHEMPASWRCVEWTPARGYAETNDNRKRERLWLSPHCVGAKQLGLFGGAL